MNEQWHQRQQQPPAEVASPLGPPPGTGHAPQPAVLVHELVTVAAAGGPRAEKCARRLAASLPPRARSALLDALAEADALDPAAGPPTGEDGPYGYEGGDALCFGEPEHPLPAARSRLSLLPAYRAPGPDPQTGTGDGGWPEPRNGPPAAVIRLRFADAIALERAGACFEGACGDPATGTLQIPADAGVEAVRAVLAALDAAALAPESFTVHSNELDDVFAAFTGLL